MDNWIRKRVDDCALYLQCCAPLTFLPRNYSSDQNARTCSWILQSGLAYEVFAELRKLFSELLRSAGKKRHIFIMTLSAKKEKNEKIYPYVGWESQKKNPRYLKAIYGMEHCDWESWTVYLIHTAYFTLLKKTLWDPLMYSARRRADPSRSWTSTAARPRRAITALAGCYDSYS